MKEYGIRVISTKAMLTGGFEIELGDDRAKIILCSITEDSNELPMRWKLMAHAQAEADKWSEPCNVVEFDVTEVS